MKLTLRQKISLSILGMAFHHYEGNLAIYVGKCKTHNLFTNHLQGYNETLYCPHCDRSLARKKLLNQPPHTT